MITPLRSFPLEGVNITSGEFACKFWLQNLNPGKADCREQWSIKLISTPMAPICLNRSKLKYRINSDLFACVAGFVQLLCQLTKVGEVSRNQFLSR
jgi:hypothetical protein